MNAVIHAGCGGLVTVYQRQMHCTLCAMDLRDAMELAPRHGWAALTQRHDPARVNMPIAPLTPDELERSR